MSNTMQGLEVRTVAELGDFPAFARATELAFGNDISDARIERWRRLGDHDRMLTVHDEGRIVATSGALTMQLAVPGATLGMAGVTAVGVHPSHRRRGLLNGMMRRMLDQARDRGEPLAGLWASESAIYGRFGFGWATTGAHLAIETRESGFRRPIDTRGRVRLVDVEGALAAFPAIYEDVFLTTPGAFARPPVLWENWLRHDEEADRDGAGPRMLAVLEGRAYAAYRIAEKWSPTGPRHTLQLLELQAVDPEAEAAMWRWVLDIDLVRELRAGDRPADEPLRHLLADPRQLRVRHADALWVRLLDVPAALEGRRYAADGRVVVELNDAYCDWTSARYEIEVSDGRASCRRTDADPDLGLGAEELGAVYLGGTSPVLLHRAGRVDEHRAGGVATAARLFAWHRAPWCPWEF